MPTCSLAGVSNSVCLQVHGHPPPRQGGHADPRALSPSTRSPRNPCSFTAQAQALPVALPRCVPHRPFSASCSPGSVPPAAALPSALTGSQAGQPTAGASEPEVVRPLTFALPHSPPVLPYPKAPPLPHNLSPLERRNETQEAPQERHTPGTAVAPGRESGCSLRPVRGEPTSCPSLPIQSPGGATGRRPRDQGVRTTTEGARRADADHNRQGRWATWEHSAASGDKEPHHRCHQ